jgi:protein-S-isoprenylcysteine O-methyltransferase Ste14
MSVDFAADYLFLRQISLMPLQEEFEKQGNFLFRYRSYFPLILYVLASLAIVFSREEIFDFQSLWWNILCVFVSFTGLLIRVVAVGYVPAGTSGRNTSEGQLASTLNTTGIYSVVRHPLYLGNYFMWLGLLLYAGPLWLVILGTAFFWVYYERIMFAEEQFLRKKFGEGYLQWASGVPAFIPALRGWKKAQLHFSLRVVLKREYSGFFGLVVSFVYLNFIKHYFYNDRLFLDPKWQIAGIAGFCIYAILKTLKKTSRLLDEKGR